MYGMNSILKGVDIAAYSEFDNGPPTFNIEEKKEENIQISAKKNKNKHPSIMCQKTWCEQKKTRLRTTQK